MKKKDAMRLRRGDSVTLKETGATASVLSVQENTKGRIVIKTDYDGYTEFSSDELV